MLTPRQVRNLGRVPGSPRTTLQAVAHGAEALLFRTVFAQPGFAIGLTPSRGNRHCRCVPPACRNGETMFTENPDPDVEAQSFPNRSSLSTVCAFPRIPPT